MELGRVRVAAYITRRAADGWELLVFDHRDFPEAGTQVPAGGVEPGELLTHAAMREIAEETGTSGVTLGTAIAVQQRPHSETGQPRVTVFFHAQTAEAGDSWTHTVASPDGDGDSGMIFCCYFIPLPDAVGLLADGQDEFIHLLEHALVSGSGGGDAPDAPWAALRAPFG